MNIIRISAAVFMIVGAGLVQGSWTNRWGSSPKLGELASRLESVPMLIGDWKGTSYEMPAADRAMAGAVACLSRRYTNPNRGVTVSVLLLGGLPGKICTHTPEVCYPGAGYSLESPFLFSRIYGSDGHPAEFRTALATRGGTSPSALRIFWGWNSSKGWSAPDEPRWQFGSASALCKLYVVRETSGPVSSVETDPSNDFLSAFLPELDRLVFSTSL
jgi:hypothetical protein